MQFSSSFPSPYFHNPTISLAVFTSAFSYPLLYSRPYSFLWKYSRLPFGLSPHSLKRRIFQPTPLASFLSGQSDCFLPDKSLWRWSCYSRCCQIGWGIDYPTSPSGIYGGAWHRRWCIWRRSACIRRTSRPE